MWVKKSDIEIYVEKTKRLNRFYRFGPVVIFVCSFIISIIFYRFDFNNYPYPDKNNSWVDVYENLHFIFIYSSILAIIYYYSYKYFVFKEKPSESICISCEATFKNINKSLCDCGGEIIEFDKLIWVDDN